MKTQTKLVWLELIGGIFGWIWLLAGATAIFFLIMVFASEWSWWNILWAVVVGAIGKWLARGFNDSKARVAYEAALVDKGMTKEEAATAWIDDYGKGRL